jgi:uncharacterized 2Fe-2S/4Fe-4S cluster protein (DUF4445 family)
MELTAPSPLDETDVVTRLKQRLGTGENPCPGFGIDLARDLPAALRESGDKVTVVRSGSRILMVESGDTTARKFGIAFDIGTTTVAGVIFDLANGVERAQASRLNAQVMLGEDAVSRVKYVLDYPDGSRIMADRVRSVVNEIILEAASRAGIDSQDIYEAVFVGNAVMFHLFLGFDPSGLAQMPFAPVTSATVNMRASEAGVAIHPKGNICFLANIGGFGVRYGRGHARLRLSFR